MNSQGDGKPTTLNKNRTTVKTFLLNILQTLVVAVGMTFIADNAAAQRKVAEPPARIKPANAAAYSPNRTPCDCWIAPTNRCSHAPTRYNCARTLSR